MNVSAVTYEAGVKAGDYATYEYIFEWKSDPPQPTPPEFEEAKQINYSLVQVKEVTDTTIIKVQETISFKNGSEKVNILIGDIETGAGNLSFQVIGRNLGVGDNISKAQDAPPINRTIPMRYAGASRNVNHIFMISASAFYENMTAFNIYWDKETGFLCEMIISSRMSTENYNITTIVRWNIIETSLWQPEASVPGWEGIAIFVIIVVGVAFYIFRKSSGKRLKRRRLKTH